MKNAAYLIGLLAFALCPYCWALAGPEPLWAIVGGFAGVCVYFFYLPGLWALWPLVAHFFGESISE